MAAGLLIFPGAQPSRSRQGTVISAELRWYLNETTTPATVYTDAAMTVPHPFPIVSDDAGRFPLIYADQADSFSCTWNTAAPDSQVQSYDFISPSTAEDVTLLDEMNAVLSDAMDLYESLEDVQEAVEEARDYAAEAADIVAGASGTNSTSTTALTIGVGTQSLSVAGGLLYVPGMNVAIASTASPSNQMSGPVQSYNATTGALVVETLATNGSGSFSAWTTSLSGVPYTLASQAEAEAGTDNTKIMTPLRVAQQYAAAKQWVQFTSTPASGTVVASGVIPMAYSEVAIVLDGVTLSASIVPTIAISTDGVGYGAATNLTSAGDSAFTGEVLVNGIRRNQGSIVVSLFNGSVANLTVSSTVLTTIATSGTLTYRATGGVLGVRLGLATAGSFSGGTVRFYGR